MSVEEKGFLKKPVTRLQGLIAGIVFGVLVLVVVPISFSVKLKDYQWQNGYHQKEIVDKRVASVETRVDKLEGRVSDAESKVAVQVALIDSAIDRLNYAVSESDPKVYRTLASKTLEEKKNPKAGINVNQTANPIINIDNSKK